MTLGPLAVAQPAWLGLGLAAAVLAWLLERRLGRGLGAAATRGSVAALIAAALADPRWGGREGAARLLLADRSASVDALALAHALPPGQVAAPVLGFGADPDRAGLAEALDALAGADGQGGRIVVASDGLLGLAAPGARALADDLGTRAAILRSAGWRLDALPVPAARAPEVSLLAAEYPGQVRAGDAFPLRLRVAASAPRSGVLSVRRAGAELLSAPVELAAGVHAMTVVVAGLREGSHRLDVALDDPRAPLGEAPPADTRLELAVAVAPPPAVLVVGPPAQAASLSASLSARGLRSAAAAPGDLPSRLSGWAAWDAAVLLDARSADFGLDQLAALEARVVDDGMGLLLTAGPGSFDAGGWSDGPLDRLSPLALEPPARERREPISLLFIVDRSASMGSVEGRGRVAKVDLAREALLQAAGLLGPADRVGLLAYDDRPEWLRPLAPLGEGGGRAELEAVVAAIGTAGGTGIGAAVDLGLASLAAEEGVQARHAILLTDGRDPSADPAALAALAAGLAGRVSLSTIAIGRDADAALLRPLAVAGGGRFHAAVEPADLPDLTLAEGQILRSGAERHGTFRAAPPAGPWHAVLAGVRPADLPAVNAYRALSIKAAARTALAFADLEPALAVWDRGLGRVAAWTSMPAGPWAKAWPGSGPAEGLLAGTVRYLARPLAVGPFDVRTWPRGASTLVGLSTERSLPAGDVAPRLEPVDDGVSPEGPVDLRQVGPGLLEARVELPARRGWLGSLRLASEGAPPPLAVGPQPGFEVVPGRATDLDRLRALAEAGGGRILTAAELGPTLASASEDSRPLRTPLLTVAAVLWLLDIGRQTRPAGRRASRQVGAS